MKKYTTILGLAVVVLALAACSRTPGKYDSFAECTKEKGAKMYGTDWCPHCKDQKELFKGSFDKADYIDCDASASKCQAAGITGYPTWVMQDGEKLVGTQSLKTLAEKTGCELKADDAAPAPAEDNS